MTPVEEIKSSFQCDDMNGLDIRFTEASVNKLIQFRQTNGCNEAGGMLFGYVDESVVTIMDISTPNATDKRSPSGFVFGKNAVKKTIDEMYQNGFHYLGDWHTHSQIIPKPSHVDKQTIRKSFNKTNHDLELMIMLILSNKQFESSYLSVTDGQNEYICHVSRKP